MCKFVHTCTTENDTLESNFFQYMKNHIRKEISIWLMYFRIANIINLLLIDCS